MWFLPLIGAAVSAVGGMISANQRAKQERAIAEAQSKPQVITNEVDYVKMREEAEKAGFNPLTVLRNGGSAGFSVQTHPALMSRPVAATSPIGEFMSGVGGLFNAAADIPMRQLEYKTAQAQLENIQADTRQRNDMFRVPTWTGGRTRSGGNWQTPSEERTIQFGSMGWEGSPGTSPMQKVEDEYGDIGALPYLVFKLPMDLWHNGSRYQQQVIDDRIAVQDALGGWFRSVNPFKPAPAGSPTSISIRDGRSVWGDKHPWE